MSQENNFIPEQEPYKKLTPFKLFVKSNFPFIEATYEALDNYGLYCKVVEYLNNVISNENAVESNVNELYDAFVSLNTYVSEFFDNLDVQEEVNNKLDEMVEDGTLDEIINTNIFDNKIDCKANYHTDWNGSTGNPFCEIADVGATSIFHLLAGSGVSSQYLMGLGVDHGTTTGLVSSVKSSDGAAIGIGATLETTAADTASAMVIQKFSDGYGLRLKNGSQPTASGKPLLSVESIYGAAGDLAQYSTPTGKRTFKPNNTIITEVWSSAAAMSTENPTSVTIDSGISTNYHYQFVRVGSNAYYGIRIRVNSVNSYIEVTSNPASVTIDNVRNQSNIDWQQMIAFGTNTMGFFGKSPVTRRQVVSPSTETLNQALVDLGLISNT